jgi:hypothetical protein
MNLILHKNEKIENNRGYAQNNQRRASFVKFSGEGFDTFQIGQIYKTELL